MSARVRPLADLLRALHRAWRVVRAFHRAVWHRGAGLHAACGSRRARWSGSARPRPSRRSRRSRAFAAHAAPAGIRRSRWTSTPVRHSCAARRCCSRCSRAFGRDLDRFPIAVLPACTARQAERGTVRRFGGGCLREVRYHCARSLAMSPPFAPRHRCSLLRVRARSLGLRRQRQAARGGDHRPESDAAGARTSLIPTVDIAPAKGWPDGAKPTPASGLDRDGARHGPRSSALAVTCCRTATCWSPRPTRRSGPSGKGIKDLRHEAW